MKERIRIEVPHKLTRDEVRSRLETGAEKFRQQAAAKAITVKQAWEGDTMSFRLGAMGQSITGAFEIEDDRVVISVDLPWFFAQMAGTVKERLKSETQQLLEKK